MPGIGNRNPEGVRPHNHRIVGTGGNPDQEKGQEQYVSISHPDVDRLSVTFEQQFGGKIEVNSVYGEGSTFKFTLKLFDRVDDEQIIEAKEIGAVRSFQEFQWKPQLSIDDNEIIYVIDETQQTERMS